MPKQNLFVLIRALRHHVLSLCQKPAWQRSYAAITLVEIMLYLGLFSMASVGIYAFITYLKTETVSVTGSLENTGQIDLARKYIQTQLGKADSVQIFDNAQTAGACLHVEATDVTYRVGLKFGEYTKAMQSSNTINIPQRAPFSVSFWLRTDQTQQGRNDLLNWGRLAENQQFAVLITNGVISLDFVKAVYVPDNVIDLRDNRWHHIALIYDPDNTQMPSPQSKWRLYIDGQIYNGTYRNYWRTTHHYLDAGNFTTVHVGSLRNSYQNRFQGALSDLRLWRAPLSASEIQLLYKNAPESDSLRSSNLQFRWLLQNLTSGQQQIQDSTGNGFTANIFGFNESKDVIAVADEGRTSKTFCFHDENNDSRYRLWASDKTASAPQATPNPSLWNAVTDDVFTPHQDGFFTAINNRPDSVTANISVTAVRQSSSFTTNTKFRHLELCKVATDQVVTATGCRFSRAFAYFYSGYDQNSDKLRIINVQGTQSSPSADVIYRNIPFASPSVVASWNAASGTMLLRTEDNSLIDAADWDYILQQIIYTPVAGSSGSKQIVLSIGDKPFIQNNKFHFYKFEQRNGGIHNFATAEQQAASQDNSYCGLQPYLMTLTSDEENAFVKAKMQQEFGDWQNGWIGASRDQFHQWRWRSGPDNQTLFWVGDGAGVPISAAGADINQQVGNRRLFPFDFDRTSSVNYYQNLALPFERDKKLRYTNFSAGTMTEGGCHTPVPYNCQPVTITGHENLAILGGPKASGLWFAHRDNTYGCLPGEINRICGHYKEWGGMPSDPDISLGGAFPIDVATHRQSCPTP